MMAGRGSIIVARLGLALRVPHFEEKPHATRGHMVNYKISTFCFRAKSGARSWWGTKGKICRQEERMPCRRTDDASPLRRRDKTCVLRAEESTRSSAGGVWFTLIGRGLSQSDQAKLLLLSSVACLPIQPRSIARRLAAIARSSLAVSKSFSRPIASLAVIKSSSEITRNRRPSTSSSSALVLSR